METETTKTVSREDLQNAMVLMWAFAAGHHGNDFVIRAIGERAFRDLRERAKEFVARTDAEEIIFHLHDTAFGTS